MLGFIITLIVASLVGWIGDSIVKNEMIGGFWEALLAGLVGSWIGAYLPFFSTMGVMIWGVAIIPTILGAALSVFALRLFKSTVRNTG